MDDTGSGTTADAVDVTAAEDRFLGVGAGAGPPSKGHRSKIAPCQINEDVFQGVLCQIFGYDKIYSILLDKRRKSTQVLTNAKSLSWLSLFFSVRPLVFLLFPGTATAASAARAVSLSSDFGGGAGLHDQPSTKKVDHDRKYNNS